MSEYRLKTGKIGEKVTSAYQKIEDTVVGAYKKIEDSFVETFLEKVEDDDTVNKTNEETAQENTENQSE